MAQLAIAAAGAVVGGMIGGPVGAQVGWALGSAVGAQFGPKQKSHGPRLEDLKVTGSEYGQTIPWAAGHPRIAGQVWWASQRREIGTTTSAGKGGGGAESTSYTYEVDILYGLVNRQILGVSRIWLNGKLIWTSLADSDTDSLVNSQNEAPWDRITVYTGESTQLPDPTYDAAVANAPAYRGRGTVFIEGLQLGNSGVIPNLTFEVVIDGAVTQASLGFLCQFDALTDATKITSDLGPDVIYDSAYWSLDTSEKRFGAASLNTPYRVDTPHEIVLDVTGKSWRIEGWINPPSTGQIVKFDSQDSRQVTLFVNANATEGWFNYNLTYDAGAAGGSSYDSATTRAKLPTGSWWHWSIQYDRRDDYIRIFANGHDYGIFGPGPGLRFSGSPFSRASFWANYGAPWNALFDSTLYRYFDPEDEDLLYPSGGSYTIPSEPFEPPPYAYNIIDPYDDTLQNVVEDLCAAGMPAGTYDVTALATITKPVRAYVLSQVATTRTAIEQLMSAYFFDGYVTDKLYFVPRAGSLADTLDADDMGAGLESPEDETLPTQIGSDLEIPAQVSLSYSNVDADYTTATEHSDRLLSGQVSTSTVQLPLGFTAAEAKGIADAIVIDGYASRVTGTFSVPLSYAKLVPTDVVAVPDADGNVYRVRIVRRTDEGPLLKFEWVLDDATVIESAGITSSDYTPTINVALPGGTIMELLDVPLMRDAENTLGHYVAATSSGTTWPGASISRSLDDVEYAEAARVSERAILGATTTTLGNWTGGKVFDEQNSVTVSLSYGTLSSSTRSAMMADASINAIMIGAELIRFRTATFVSTGVYTLSGLLRGQNGTEWAMAGHSSSDRVVLMQSAGMRYVAIDLPSLSAERFYKGVTLGKSLASVTGESFTCEGVSLMPLAPVNLRRTVGTGNQITVTWDRRTRMACTFTGAAGISVPLGELTEAYEVDVVLIAGSVLKRTLSVTSASAIYTAAMQTTDGIGPSTPIRFDVYQMSAVVGRGYVASLTTAGAVTPQPQITTLTVGGTFATGAALYATLGGVTYNYTSVGGDTNLAGIATSFAAVIDAASAYTATALSGVITVTGPTSTPFPVVAGVGAGDNTTTWALTQTASAAVAGVSNKITFRWLNLGDPAGANAYPLGMTMYALVQRISPPLNLTYSYVTTPSGRTNYEVLPIAAAAIRSAFNASGDGAAYGLSMTLDDAPTSTLALYTPASEPYNWTVQAIASDTNVSGLVGNSGSGVTPASLRPQIATLTLAGTPVTGRIYRATLGGVNYDYTATGGDTTMALVASGLAGVIDAAASYIASAVGAVITITHASNNVAFTYSATVIASTVTLTADTTQEAA